MTRKHCAFVFCFLMILIVSAHAFGQAAATGGLSGTVTDPSGSVVAGATLTLTQPNTGSKNVQVTNSVGAYVFPTLQVGDYRLEVSAMGFATTVIQSIAVSIGRVSNLNVDLKMGSTRQEVQVSTADQVLETTTNTLVTTIAPDTVQDLPLNGRDTLPFAQLTPGAQSGGDQRFTTFNALPAAALNITVDGMNNNFQRYRTSTTGFYAAAPLRLGAIEEVSVSTDGLTADAGAEGAVTLRFQIKRGTNKFHGSAFLQHQNSALNANTFANNALGLRKQPYHLNDWGGNIGGPLFRDRLFFFFNYEQEFVPKTNLGTAYVLTPSAQSGNFTYTGTDGQAHTVNVLDVAKNNGFTSAIDSRVANELQQINTFNKSATASATVLPYQSQENWTYANTTKNVYPTLRLDYQITPRFDFHAAYNLYWRSIPGTQNYAGNPYTVNAFRSSYSTLTAGGDWTITSNLVDQFNFGLLNTQERYNPTNSFSPYGSINNVIFSTSSFVNGSAALSQVLSTGALPNPRNNPVRDIFDNLTWTRGRHTFTFGGDYRNSNSKSVSVSNPPSNTLGISSLDPVASMFNPTNFPQMSFAQLNHQDLLNAENLYATLTGRISVISGSNNLDSASGQYKMLGAFQALEAQAVGGFYFQDAWRVTQHFALNYGMRFQFSGAIHNTNNAFVGPTYSDLLGPSSGLFQPGTLNGVSNPQLYLRPSPYPGDMNQPSPNFGFAWNPDFDGGNIVIRGGGSISHYDEGWTTFEQATTGTNPGTKQAVAYNSGPSTNTPPTQFPAGSLTLSNSPSTSSSLPSSPATFSFPIPESNFTFNSQSFAAVDPNLRSPYIEKWYFGIQKKIPYDTVIEVNYVGNHAVHMWQNLDLNEVNIFENGFLQQFQNAQVNLAASGSSFAGSNVPMLTQAFGPNGSAFTNPTYTGYVRSGQAGALANVITSSSTFFCNLVGNANGSFAPCAALGYKSGTQYPINTFQVNPYATGQRATILSDPGSSTYNGLQTQIKHPTGHGLTFLVNYAYSHAFTNRFIGDYNTSDQALANYTTLRNPRLNRAPSPYDLRHAFKAYAVYTLPFTAKNRLMKEAVEGWTLSPIITWQSGRNFRILGGTNTYNYYTPYSTEPATSDSGVVLNGATAKDLQKSVGYYRGPNTTVPRLLMDPAVFTSGKITATSTPGQLGQQVYLTAPQYVNTDFAVSKAFPIFERLKLNFQAEMLNVFNHPAWSVQYGSTNNPAQYVNLQNSPVVPGRQTNPQGLGSGGSRDIQFRVQLAF